MTSHKKAITLFDIGFDEADIDWPLYERLLDLNDYTPAEALGLAVKTPEPPPAPIATVHAPAPIAMLHTPSPTATAHVLRPTLPTSAPPRPRVKPPTTPTVAPTPKHPRFRKLADSVIGFTAIWLAFLILIALLALLNVV